MHPPLIAIRDLSIGFYRNTNTVTAVQSVNLDLYAGKTLALMGESGCGKTLTASAIMQLLPNNAWVGSTSQILYHEQDLLAQPVKTMRRLRGIEFAMIFQEPMTAFNAVLTIGDQMKELITQHGIDLAGESPHTYCYHLLEKVGLNDVEMVFKAYPHQLSGGMRQRAFIAMALVGKPRLLIADEPTTALDPTLQLQVLNLLKSLQRSENMALLFITHNLALAKHIADDIAIMYAGQIIEQGPSHAFFQTPLHPYSQALIAANPEQQSRDKPLPAIPGNVPPIGTPLPPCRFAPRCAHAWHTCYNAPPEWPLKHNEQSVRCHLYDTTQPQANGYEAVPSDTQRYADTRWPASMQFEACDLIEIQGATVTFQTKRHLLKHKRKYLKAVDGVSFKLARGRTLALVGESGSGKTSLAKALVGLNPLSSGEIIFHTALTSRPQMVFQDPSAALDPRMLILESLKEARDHVGEHPSPLATFSLEKILALVGLDESNLYRYPHEFSGGQKQRINIARALAAGPEMLICDEPTSALDVSIQAQILNLLKRIQREFGLTYVFITHDMAVVATMADDIAVMRQGQIIEYAKSEQILNTPKHPYTQTLLSAIPKLVPVLEN